MKLKHLLKSTITTAGVLHCINKVIESSISSNTHIKNSGKYYHWKHGDIFYKVAGNGDPLLLIHDLTVFSSSSEWSQVINQLSTRYKVYTIDLIGCGKSEKPSLTYTNYFYVQLITDFIKDVIGKKTSVAVTGFSSSFVLMSNKLDKDIFESIVLVNPSSISLLKKTPNERSKILFHLFNLPIISKTLFYILTNKTNAEHYLTEKCFYNPFNLKPSFVKAYHTAAHENKGNGKYLLGSLLGCFVNADITAALMNIDNDITLITGSQKLNHKESLDSYSKLNPYIIKRTISSANHLPQLECPDEFISTLLQVL